MIKKRVFIINNINELQKVVKFVLEKNINIISLTGNLGSGKTTFTKILAKKLGICEEITSPTFNIFKVYKINCGKKIGATKSANWQKLCHIDAYRLKDSLDLKELGIEEYFNDPNILTVIEWANKVYDILPKNCLTLKFIILEKERRSITADII